MGFSDTVDVGGNAVTRGVLWRGGTATNLGTLIPDPVNPGAFLGNSQALAINDRGLIVGVSDAATGVQHAVLFDPSVPVPRDLGSLVPFLNLPGTADPSRARSINNSGDIVGQAAAFDSQGALVDRAFLLSFGALLMTDLGTLQTTPGISGSVGNSEAFAISDNGTIVGVSDTGAVLPSGQPLLAAVQFATTPPPTALLPAHAEAIAINSGGDVVGAFNDPPQGFVFRPGAGFTDLTNLLAAPGPKIVRATGINQSGQITALAEIGGASVGVLLTP